MSARAKAGGIVVTVAALLGWWFWPSPAAPELTTRSRRPESRPQPESTPRPSPPAKTVPPSRAAGPVAVPDTWNERTLVGTKWERDGFALEFGADGKLLIGGRERARWRVEGSRIRLHREATGEEHWLDIVGGKLTWEGREITHAR